MLLITSSWSFVKSARVGSMTKGGQRYRPRMAVKARTCLTIKGNFELSPQRGSFNHCCRAHKVNNPAATGRIERGRIIREPWDCPEKTTAEYVFRRERRVGPQVGDGGYERRSFGRDFGINRDKNRDWDIYLSAIRFTMNRICSTTDRTRA